MTCIVGLVANKKRTPKEVVISALEAAAYCSGGVCAPFNIISE